MSQLIKKIISSLVTLTTIAWSVGIGAFALPSVATAATLTAGDLIKASGPGVYYYAADQKRYVFPNETTYKSWYADFSSVKTITDVELSAIPMVSNVTIRPGTKLVKITTDPKVYAVTSGGFLHWVESEAVATSLYGSSWAQRVVDVPDAFFMSYTVGSSISTAAHPDGSIVSYSGSSDRYVVDGGKKRKIASDAAFTANGWNAADVIQTSLVYAVGTDVTGREANFADTVKTSAALPPATGSLTVSLASDTPAGTTVPKNGASVALAKFNLVSTGVEVKISGIKVHRLGVGSTSDFTNVYLYDVNGARITTGRTINSTTNTVEFNSLNITVPAGQTKPVIVQGDFGASSSGGQHSFELLDAASVVVTGGATIGGSFPVRGNMFTVGNANAGRLDVQKGTTPANPNIGAMEAEISNFKLIANTNDIELRRITLFQGGTVSNTDLTDLKLYQGTNLLATAAALTGDKMVFNLTNPYLITNGTTKVFTVKSKVGGRSGRTITTYVEYTTDVYAVDKVYSAGAAVCIASTATGGCTAASQGSFDGSGTNLVTITTQGGQLTVNFNGPTNQNVAKGSQDVVLFKFSLASPDNTLEIRNLDFRINGQSASGITSRVQGNSGTDYFRDIKIKNLDTGETLMGPTSLTANLSDKTTSGIFTLNNSFNINAGQILSLGITADLSNSEDADLFFTNGTSTYKVVLGDSSGNLFGSSDVRVVSTGEFLDTAKIVPNTTINGNNQAVKAAGLDVSLASSPASATVVKKQINVSAVGLVLSAGAQSDITVTAVKLTGSGNTTNDNVFAVNKLKDVVTGCGLYDGATQVGLSQAPDTTLGTVNITNMNLPIPRGTTKTLAVKCTTDSTISRTAGDRFALGIATAATDVTAQDSDSNSVTPTLSTGVANNAGTTFGSLSVIQTVVNSGTLTIASDNLRQSTILVAGGDFWNNLAQFKATAQYENITLDRVNVSSTGDAASFQQIAIAKDGGVKGWDVLPSGSLRSKDIDLTGNTVVVPMDGSVTFQVWGKLANTQSSSSVNGATSGVSRSGATIALGLGSNITTGEWDSNYNDKLNVRAVGGASGERVYATSTNMSGGPQGNSFVVRKTKPTVTRQIVSPSSLSNGTVELYKFQVSADTAGSIALKKYTLSFNKSTSSASSLDISTFRLLKGSTPMNTADYSITNQNGTDLTSASWPNGSSTGLLAIVFTGEETIAGTGNVYTLQATISGSAAGDSVSVSFRRTGDTTVRTGYLTATAATSTVGGYNLPGPQLDLGIYADGFADNSPGTFVWADNSEVPHSAAAGGTTGSRDWTDDVYVDDLNSVQVLSR